MRRLSVLALAVGLLIAGSQVANAQSAGPSACDYSSSYGDIPCTEVDRAITESAAEFGVDEGQLRTIVECESKFDPYADGGPYEGLFQQANSSWGERVAEFNAAVDPDVPGNINSPFDNARVSARMLATDGTSHWPNCA